MNHPTTAIGHPRYCGNYATEEESCAALDALLARSGLFSRVLTEVDGYYIAHRPHNIEKGARIDRILIPGERLIASGWRDPIGIECKRSGDGIGHGVAQSIDYTYCIFRRGVEYFYPTAIFLWPLEMPKGPIQSVMVQNRIGALMTEPRRPLKFELERMVIQSFEGGDLKVQATVAGAKKGSR